jgi:molybdopterin converting factor small subunit
MDIKVRLFATLRDGRGKELMLKLDEKPNVEMVLKELEIDERDVAILLINGRDGAMDRILTEGDVVSLFPPVGGG